MAGRNRLTVQKLMRWASRLSVSALVLCAGTGAVLCLQYRPMGDVFRCVEEMTSLAPYGWLLRRLHYLSGQIFAGLALAHAAYRVARGDDRRMEFAAWARLTFSAAACLLLLFTGFLLKGDAEAEMAAVVARSMAEQLPLVGAAAAGLVVGRGEWMFFPSYLLHCFLLPMILAGLLRGHVRRWAPAAGEFLGFCLALGLLALAIPLPVPHPPQAPAEALHGPWFFLGLQHLLAVAPSAAGMVAPAGLLALLLALPLLGSRASRAARSLLAACVAGYAVLAWTL